MGRRVSLKDIAAKTEVSIATVSYVLNGLEKEKRIGAEVAKKIHDAAEELNYQPDEIAKSLRSGSTKSIGLVVADIANPFFSQLARIIEDMAFSYEYTVLFGSSDEDENKSEALVKFLLSRRVDGLIIVPTEGSINLVRTLCKKKTPFVLIDRYFPEVNTNCVILDNYQAAFDATVMLIQKGYKRICLMVYQSELIHMKERERGYYDALKESGLEMNGCITRIRYSHTHDDIDQAINALLVAEKKTEAIFFATNTLSVAGLMSITKNNVLIPEQLAVVGFDGGDVFDLYRTPLTFVKQPIEEMGREAFKVLVELFNGSTKTSRVILQPSLEIRDSC
jgi:LacI family transcriptional regulator